MPTISFRINDDDKKFINDYVRANNLNLSQFIRNTIIEKIEDEMEMSEAFEKELLKAKESAKYEKQYTFQEVRKLC